MRIRIGVLLFIAAQVGIAAGQWQSAPGFASTRKYVNGLNFGGSLYAIGGTPWQNGGDQDGAVDSRTLSAATWSPRVALEGIGPIVHQGAAVDNLGRMIVFGGVVLGSTDPGTDSVYDPSSGPTTAIASRSSQAPSDNFAFCTDGDGLVYSLGGGKGASATTGNPNKTRVERYDAATNSWSVLASMITACANAAAAYDGQGRILVFGGINSNASARLSNVAAYDIATNAWSDTTVPDLPVALSHARALLGSDGRVYVIGGVTGPLAGGTIVNTVYKLNVAANTWETGPSLATARREFGAARGDDDYIYVFGGETPSGDTSTSEKLYTPPCPTFDRGPRSVNAWAGIPVGLSVQATGAAPITYQWRKDGIALTDGPTGGGSTISGANTNHLVISGPSSADEGSYDIVASNACGASISPSATLLVRSLPTLPTNWQAVSLHPDWSLYSYGNGLSGGVQVGSGAIQLDVFGDGTIYTVARPIEWTGSAASAIDRTPDGSIGGEMSAVDGTSEVGWWWWPYTCYYNGQFYTCYSQQAAAWFNGTFANYQISGQEFSEIFDVNGTTFAGAGTNEIPGTETPYLTPFVWLNSPYATQLHSPTSLNFSTGIAYATSDGLHFGLSYGDPYVTACRWDEDGYLNLHPADAYSSYLLGARDELAVGRAVYAGLGRAIVVSGTATSYLGPSGTENSAARTRGGLQVGVLGGHAVLWAGPDALLDLHSFLAANYSASTASDVEIDGDGVISVVGSAFNSAAARWEAVHWISTGNSAPCPGDLDGDRDVDLTDLGIVLAAYGVGPAGDLDGDGDTDLSDLGVVLAGFGAVCP